MSEYVDPIKKLYPEKNVVPRRIVALALDALLAVVFIYCVKLIGTRLSNYLLLAALVSSFTVFFTYFAGSFQKYIDKCKERYDDLVFIEADLNMALNALSDNAHVLAPFLESPPRNHGITFLPESIALDKSVIKRIWNGRLLNDLFILYDDYRRANSSIVILKDSYDRTLFSLPKDIAPPTQIIQLNIMFKKQTNEIVVFLEELILKTEKEIALVIALRKYLYPNIPKYLFWYLTDWGMDVFAPLKGFFFSVRYVKNMKLEAEASVIYKEWKELQKIKESDR